MKLLELLIALTLSAILWVIMDTVYSGLWQTRTHLEQSHDELTARQLPVQWFDRLLYHAGHLGCRALHDGIVIKAPTHVPNIFFIHQSKAIDIKQNELWVHETLSHQIVLTEPVNPNTILSVPQFAEKSDWLIISDCLSAELVPEGGITMQSYQPPVYLVPVLVCRWYLKGETVYRQQMYPQQSAQPVFSPVKAWRWQEEANHLLRLSWEVFSYKDDFIFELRNQ